MSPRISIITITQNRADFLSHAVDSVRRQTFQDWELIILDDASTDSTPQLCATYTHEDPRITYHANTAPCGIPKSRNKAMSYARGDYIAVLDDDDTWINTEKLQKQHTFLESYPAYCCIGSNIRVVTSSGVFMYNTDFGISDTAIRQKMLTHNQIAHSTAFIRRACLKTVGNYDETLPYAEDADLFLRLGLCGKIANLKEITTAYTRHADGISNRKALSISYVHLKLIVRFMKHYPRGTYACAVGLFRMIGRPGKVIIQNILSNIRN